MDVKQEQVELLERLTVVVDEAASVESARLSWKRQVDALRECQGLAQEARATEQELASHREHEQVIQKRLEQLRFRLGQALASTGSISRENQEVDYTD